MPAKAANQWDDIKGFLGEAEEVVITEEVTEDKPQKLSTEPLVIDTKRSEAVEIDTQRPQPPFWGTKLLQPEDIPMEELFWYLDLQALIAGQWQFRKPKEQTKEEYQAFLEKKVYPILASWKARIIEEKLLHPQVIYGYFPCNSQGNTLYIYDVNHQTEVKTSFEFPRQKSLRRLCIADFFAPKESGIIDVFPMQAVTVGEIATEFAQKLFADNLYTDYLYFHGLAVQVAEALAEWTHARIRQELGFGTEEPDNIRDILAQRYRGSRYSFGYPACPNIQDQYKQLNLLGADQIGMHMDESEQLYPEQSTTAIIAYHPVAKYFSA
jgi:5-methyltetrahydrofolate--homocysteine methyltransferase